MRRLNVLIYLLLSLTSVHVLVADVSAHEVLVPQPSDTALGEAHHDHSVAGDKAASVVQHCCQCHGFVSPPPVLPAGHPSLSPHGLASMAKVPSAPSFDFYRPPIALVTA